MTLLPLLLLLALSSGNIHVVPEPAAPDSGSVHAVSATGDLSENILIASEALGYDLQYRVYVPDGADSLDALPTLYVFDGQWYLSEGRMEQTLDSLISQGRVDPVLAVFVDNRDPHNLQLNRRNGQFFCNPRYIRFFEEELVPTVDAEWPTQPSSDSRSVLGLSFGGLAAACFGLHAHDTFGGIAMQSPAMHPVPSMWDAWADSSRLPVRIFLSSGDHNDNEARTRRLRDILQAKEYDMHYKEVPFAHTWRNWRPLLDDVLLFFYGG